MKGKVTREKERVRVHLFAPQMDAAARVRWAEARILELLLGLSCMCSGPSSWALLHCLPRTISRELGQRWSSWDVSRCPYGIWCCRQWRTIPDSTLPTSPLRIAMAWTPPALRRVLIEVKSGTICHSRMPSGSMPCGAGITGSGCLLSKTTASNHGQYTFCFLAHLVMGLGSC